MNKKIIFKTALGDIRYCVLDTATDCISQMEKVFGVEKGYGFSIEMDEKEIRLKDYFAGETRTSFPIVAMEDSSLPVCLEQVREERE